MHSARGIWTTSFPQVGGDYLKRGVGDSNDTGKGAVEFHDDEQRPRD